MDIEIEKRDLLYMIFAIHYVYPFPLQGETSLIRVPTIRMKGCFPELFGNLIFSEAKMNEPILEPVAPPKKATPWKIIIPVGIAVILCCICLVVVGVLAYLGTQGTGPLSMLATATYTPTKIPTRTFTPTMTANVLGDWDVYYDWNCTGSYNGPVVITFYGDQTYMLTEGNDYGYGTWTLTGSYFDFMFDTSPHAHYVGYLDYTSTYLEGTMSTDDGSSGCWYAYKR